MVWEDKSLMMEVHTKDTYSHQCEQISFKCADGPGECHRAGRATEEMRILSRALN